MRGHHCPSNGTVRHTFFKRPVFKFDITEAHNFLSFNATPKQYPDWYGTIYGNGGASISGYPGVVNIDVDMTSSELFCILFFNSRTIAGVLSGSAVFTRRESGVASRKLINSLARIDIAQEHHHTRRRGTHSATQRHRAPYVLQAPGIQIRHNRGSKLINEYVSASSLSDSMKVNDERGAVVMSTSIFTTPG